MSKYDAIVVGSGPNGLAAAIRLAQAKLRVLLIEGKNSVGGGMRSAELTLPGYKHDICSSIHPFAIGSPFFSSLPLEQHGLTWIQPSVPLAHPFKDQNAVLLRRSIDSTCQSLGNDDGIAYKKLIEPYITEWPSRLKDILAPLHVPKSPLKMLRFAYHGVQSAETLINKTFKNQNARALFAGLSAHSILPLDKYLTAAFGMIFSITGHVLGWPMPKGGAQSLTDALASYFCALGGHIQTETMIENFEDLLEAKIILFDVSPKQLLKIMKDKFPINYQNQLKKYRYGPGIFKIDWALSQPIPWKDKECLRAGTVHLGGTFEEIADSERDMWEGRIGKNNFIILTQPTVFDSTRAPIGKHIAWAYCHVPNSSTVNLADHLESQIEGYAPGFRDCILARKTTNTKELENYNPNCIGGCVNGGVSDISQLFARPTASIVPYSTPQKGIYICSASTPPGGGVHGMCGFYAAEAALKEC